MFGEGEANLYTHMSLDSIGKACASLMRTLKKSKRTAEKEIHEQDVRPLKRVKQQDTCCSNAQGTSKRAPFWQEEDQSSHSEQDDDGDGDDDSEYERAAQMAAEEESKLLETSDSQQFNDTESDSDPESAISASDTRSSASVIIKDDVYDLRRRVRHAIATLQNVNQLLVQLADD